MTNPKSRVELSHTPDYDGDDIEDRLAGGADIDELIASGDLDDDFPSPEEREADRKKRHEFARQCAAVKYTGEAIEF